MQSPLLIQKHSHAGDLSDDLDILRKLKDLRRTQGRRMGLHDQGFIALGAPAAGITGAVLHEINGAFEFVTPARILDFTPRIVNGYECSRLNQRVHVPVVGPDHGVAQLLCFQRTQHGKRHLSPARHVAAEESCFPGINTWIEGKGSRYFAFIGAEFNQVRAPHIDG